MDTPAGNNQSRSERFAKSLINWGGWAKLITNTPDSLLEPVSDSIRLIAQHQAKLPPRVGKLSAEEWGSSIETLPLFLNAYLQQEMDRIIDGPNDLLMALRFVDDSAIAQFLMAAILAGRELRMNVEVCYKFSYSGSSYDSSCDVSCRKSPATLTIAIAQEYAEERIPLVLRYHGQEFVWDKDESTPQNPVHVPMAVDQSAVVFFDGSDHHDATLQQRQRDDFFRQQGYQVFRFSPTEVVRDTFACATEAIKLISGKKLPPAE